jgi:hypothetical protein
MSESTNPNSAPAGLMSTERYFGPGDANGRYLVLVVDEIVGEEEAYRTSDLAVAAAEFDRCQAHHPYVTAVSIYDTVEAETRKLWQRDPDLTPQTALARCPY